MPLTMETNIHEITVNGNKFKIQLRDIIWAVTTFLALVGIYFAATISLQKNSDGLATSVEDREKLWGAIREMNDHGTIHSHLVDEKQQQSIDLLSGNYGDLNRQLRDLAPKVDKIDTNVLWLMAKQLERK